MDLFPKNGNSMSPEAIVSKLFMLHAQAHVNHLNTRSYARHKALDGLYSELEDWRDKIAELLLGYLAPNRLGQITLGAVDSRKTDEQLVAEGIQFADDLYNYGERTNWRELSNFAADLEGLFVKTKYLLTLS